MPWTVSPSVADSITTEVIAPGIRAYHLVRNTGPLRAHVLDIDLAACVSLQAVKGADIAVGRATTSDLLRHLPVADVPLAAVNADFFLFTPPGVPTGALVVNGKLLAGPIERPVLAFDNKGHPFIGALHVDGTLSSRRGRMPIVTWNRPGPNAIGIVDAAWGQPLDSLSRPGALQLIPLPDVRKQHRYVVAPLPSRHNGQSTGDTLMLVGHARASVAAGDTVTVTMSLAPIAPHNAVGGFPLLVHDSVIAPGVDSAGAVSFRGLNPRTAAGFAANGRRLLLVVTDGRQAGFSMGTTTRETAALLRDLGAVEAINLDGGGSTAMAVRDMRTGAVRVFNKPSDATGERPVGDALAVFGRCR